MIVFKMLYYFREFNVSVNSAKKISIYRELKEIIADKSIKPIVKILVKTAQQHNAKFKITSLFYIIASILLLFALILIILTQVLRLNL